MPNYNQLNQILKSPYQETKEEKESSSIRLSPSILKASLEGLTSGMAPSIQAAGRGLAKGATLGYADELSGALEALKSLPKEDEEFGEAYKRGREESREEFKKAEEQYPGMYTTGDIIGSLGTAIIPGLAGVRAAKGLAGIGAAQGAGRAEADLTEGEIGEVGKEAIAGGLLGLAGGKVAEKFPRLLSQLKTRKKLREISKTLPKGPEALTKKELKELSPEVAKYKATGKSGPSIKKLEEELAEIGTKKSKEYQTWLKKEMSKWGFDNEKEFLEFYKNYLKRQRGLGGDATQELSDETTKLLAG